MSLTDDLKKHYEEGRRLYNEAHAVLERGDLKAEDNIQIDNLLIESKRQLDLASRAKKLMELEADQAKGKFTATGKPLTSEEAMVGLNDQLLGLYRERKGQVVVKANGGQGAKGTEYRKKVTPYVLDPLTSGGYAGREPDLYNQIISEPMDAVYLSARATHIMTNSTSVHVPTWAGSFTPVQRDTNGTAFTVHTPGATDFGREELIPHQFGFVLQIERKLLKASPFDLASFIVRKDQA
jgi:hypothetical protein